jgi:hypothetical protein
LEAFTGWKRMKVVKLEDVGGECAMYELPNYVRITVFTIGSPVPKLGSSWFDTDKLS